MDRLDRTAASRPLDAGLSTRWLRLPAFWSALALVLAAAAGVAVPFLAELPVYLEDAVRLADGLVLTPGSAGFFPVGYTVVLGALLAAGGITAIIAGQCAAHGITAWIVARRAASVLETEPWWPAAGLAAAVCAHPYLLLNVTRVNESAFTVPLFLALSGWFVDRRRLQDVRWSVLLGVILALLVQMRPNAAVFLVVPALALVGPDRRSGAAALAACSAAFAAVHALISLAATGSPVFWPANGPYNLFAGNNPFTADALWHYQNGEPSIGPALRALGIAAPADPATLTTLALSHMAEHPFGTMALMATKAVTFFSPRLANAGSLTELVVQSALCFPVIVFVWAEARLVRRAGWRDTAYHLLFVALFTAPFLLTNADPRMRLPLDVCMLGFAVAAWATPSACAQRRGWTSAT